MRTTLTLLVVSLLMLAPGAAHGDTDDLFALGLEPNVMLLMDTSSSMDKTIPSDLYNPSSTYPGPYSSAKVYNQTGPTTYVVYKNNIAQVADESARTALSTMGFWDGKIGGAAVSLFIGNYLNLKDCGAACTVMEKKLDIAKRVFTNIIQNVNGVRFGVMRLRKKNPDVKGGEIISTIGTDKTTMVNAINSIVYESGTPIGEQLYDAGQYFKGLPLLRGQQFPSPIQNECQPNFVIQISDGRQNGNLDVRNEATNRYTQDHATLLTGMQNVITHMVGLDLAGDPAAIQELQEAAANGGGNFYTADEGSQLAQALEDAIFVILADTLSTAAPSVPAARSASGNALYLASFTPSIEPFWAGKLTAYPLKSDGTIQTAADGTITATPLWEAHTVLNGINASNRNLSTVTSGTTVQKFNPNMPNRAALNVTLDLNGDGSVNDQDAKWLIDYVQGNNNTNPAWKLGDIYHSSPVVIGPPASAYVDLNLDRTIDTSFPLFRQTFKTRDRVLYTGSNGGMLHAFHAGTWQGTAYDNGTGKERWGFIPPNLLPKLQNMVREHTYYVDGPPRAADVWMDGLHNDGTTSAPNNVKAANEWHTVIVTGERRGGNAYFALDVTNPGTAASPDDPKYLWTFTDPNLGPTWSQPAIGKVKLSLDGGTTTIERWVAFVGGGYGDFGSVGKAFFVIDINTGVKLWEYTVANDATMDQIPASPTLADTNGDGFVDRAYVGDVSGNIWRFDLQAVGTTMGLGTLVSGWTASKLFTASSGQPIYDQLAVAADPTGMLYVYGGTGDLNDLLNQTSLDRFYAIQEHYPKATGTPPATLPAVITDADLADTTGLNTLNVNDPAFSGKVGWYLSLSAGEKVLSDAEVFAGVVLFTSFYPTVATCTQRGGETTLYALSYLTGGGASDYNAYKAGTDGLSKTVATYGGLSAGPQISLPPTTSTGALSGGDVVLFVCTSSEVCGNPPAPQPGGLRTIDYWRDL